MNGTLVKLKQVGQLIKNAWLMIGMTLVSLCLLEGGASLIVLVLDRVNGTQSTRADTAETVSEPSWVRRYAEEERASRVARWKPYVYWRQSPYRGDFINISADGIRITSMSDSMHIESNTPIRIFMFGGSTLWGTGARDGFTIPSILAKELRKSGVMAQIVNFGQSGYVNTQEVIELILRLRENDIPNLAIFLDGVNDTVSAYQQGVAGLPQNEHNRAKEFNLSKPERFKDRVDMALRDIARSLSVLRLSRALWKSRTLNDAEATVNQLRPDDNLVGPPSLNRESLAREVIRTYTANIELVEALGEHYDFGCFFYWQPTIFEKKHLTKYEQSLRDRRLLRDEKHSLEQFFRMTYSMLQQSPLVEQDSDSFYDLSGIFSNVGEQIFADWSHPGEFGNEMIAKRMAHDILDTISTNKQQSQDTVRRRKCSIDR